MRPGEPALGVASTSFLLLWFVAACDVPSAPPVPIGARAQALTDPGPPGWHQYLGNPPVLAAATFDAARDRLVFHEGGQGQGDSLWEWALESRRWQYRAMSNAAPHNGASLTFMPAEGDDDIDQLLLFGGAIPAGISETATNDLFRLDGQGSSWERVSTFPSPPPRKFHAATRVPGRGLFVFGGLRSADCTFFECDLLSDLWQLGADGRWTALSPSGPVPPPRQDHAMAFDELRDKLVVWGGRDLDGLLTDVWEWTASTNAWELREADAPRLQGGGPLVYDGAIRSSVLYADVSDSAVQQWSDSGLQTILAPGPPRFSSPRGAIEPVTGQFFIATFEEPFSALEAPDVSVWEWLEIDAWALRSAPSAPFLHRRTGHAAAYHAGRGRLVVFGGVLSDNEQGDTWEWDPVTESWQARSFSTSPGPRQGHAMAYDPEREAIILYGGTRDGTALQDTWRYDGTSWTRLSQAGPPNQDSGHALAYDSKRHRMMLFGVNADGESWALDGTEWRQQSTTGSRPRGNTPKGAAYDPPSDRFVVSTDGETHEFVFSEAADAGNWEVAGRAPIAPRRVSPLLTYDARRDVVLLLAGNEFREYEREARQWQFVDQSAEERSPMPDDAFVGGYTGDRGTFLAAGESGLWEWVAGSLPAGAACQAASVCQSGTCQGGACCSGECSGSCQTCAGAEPGQCSNVAVGAVGACGEGFVCGAGARCVPQQTGAESPVCNPSPEVPPAECSVWSKMATLGQPPSPIEPIVVDPACSTALFASTHAASSGDQVFKSVDGGESWQPSASLQGGASSIAFSAVSRNRIYATSPFGFTPFVSEDGGSNWSSLGFVQSVAILTSIVRQPESESELFVGVRGAGSSSGGVFRSINGGQNFASVFAGVDIHGLAFDSSSPPRLYAWSHDSGLYRDPQVADQRVLLLPIEGVRSFAANPREPSTLFAGVVHPDAGGVYRSTDGLFDWDEVLEDVDVAAVALDPGAPERVFAGSRGEGVYRSINGGESWDQLDQGWPGGHNVLSLAIAAGSTSFVYAATDDGIYRLADCDTDAIEETDGGAGAGGADSAGGSGGSGDTGGSAPVPQGGSAPVPQGGSGGTGAGTGGTSPAFGGGGGVSGDGGGAGAGPGPLSSDAGLPLNDGGIGGASDAGNDSGAGGSVADDGGTAGSSDPGGNGGLAGMSGMGGNGGSRGGAGGEGGDGLAGGTVDRGVRNPFCNVGVAGTSRSTSGLVLLLSIAMAVSVRRQRRRRWRPWWRSCGNQQRPALGVRHGACISEE